MCEDSIDKSEKYQPTEKELQQIYKIPIVLSYKFSKRYDYSDRSELESVANIGLAKALISYRPDKGKKLSNYVYLCCVTSIREYFRSYRCRIKRIGAISLEAPIINIDKEITLKDNLLDKSTLELEVTRHERLEISSILISRLKGIAKKIVTMRIAGDTYVEMEKALNIDKTSLRSRFHRAINKLRRGLNDLSNNQDDAKYLRQWEKNNPEESKKILQEGRLKGNRKTNSLIGMMKRKIGWINLSLSQCKILNLMSDMKVRTNKEVAEELCKNRQHITRTMRELKDLSYIRRIKGGINQPIEYLITEKAINERRKSNG